MAGAVAAVGLLGCVDLFHSTDFAGPGCTTDAGDPCADAGMSRTDATNGHDASGDGRSGGRDGGVDGGSHDATTDHGGTKEGGHANDGSGDSGAGGGDAGHDAQGGIDGGHTDFCYLSPSEAAAAAQHACLWLGACVGAEGINAYGPCYSAALSAYSCAAYPTQRVRGALFTYWNALAQAETCADVVKAVFGGTDPSCGTLSTGCGNDLIAGGSFDIAFSCGVEGSSPLVQNCAAIGYTCGVVGSASACVLNGAVTGCTSSSGATSTSCSADKKIFHACETVTGSDGTVTAEDVGRSCQYFGGGSCDVNDAGVAGCLAYDAGAPCTPEPFAACDGQSAIGCATGNQETVDCTRFSGGGCSTTSAVSATNLAAACFAQSSIGQAATCSGDAGAVAAYASVGGSVAGSCASAGLGACAVGANGASCAPP
jgi:hypothetical protein